MNSIYRSIWNDKTGTFVAVSENAKSAGKKASSCTSAAGAGACFALNGVTICLMMAFGANAYAGPAGGVVAAGGASISSSAGSTTINQSTQNAAINWQSFNIAQGESVRFVQPNSNSVALNRVLGSNPSSILGSLSANGKVFLVNPNGILFGKGASVNVGGLVASTRNITDSDFMAGSYKFSGEGNGTVLNQGAINADGGYVALLGANVGNDGVISAKLGTVALAAGNAVTLDVAGDGLLNVTVDQGAMNALVQNGGLIQAAGGQVLLSAQAAGSLLQNAVNNTGVIQAQTIENHNGTIKLLGGMQSGTVNVGGTLDASAPNGGNGGFIETSAANVKIASGAKVTTAAAQGLTGSWLIDPQDFTIGSGATDNITGADLSNLLVTNSIVISTNTGPDATVAGTPPVRSLNTAAPGNGDIFVNEAVSWTATPSTTTLTLNAARDVIVNKAISATNGNVVVCCGRDVTVNEAITTVNGSVLLSAGRDVNLNAALTTTDGNITMCAANDVNVSAKISLTRGSSIPAQSLGLPLGLVLSAGYGGTGPGIAGGTVVFAPLTPPAPITGPNAPVNIYYNPISYTAPTDYLPNFTLTLGSTLTQRMLVFPDGANKTFDGTTTARFSGLKGAPAGVTLDGSGAANFDTSAVGTGKTITFSGYSLGGANANNFALPVSCCAPVTGRTTANITGGTNGGTNGGTTGGTSGGTPTTGGAPGATEQPIATALGVTAGTALATIPAGTLAMVPTESLGVVPAWMPAVVQAETPPQLQTVVPPNTPPAAPPMTPPVTPPMTPPVVPTEAPPAVPVEAPPPVYVPPHYPRKQDRN